MCVFVCDQKSSYRLLQPFRCLVPSRRCQLQALRALQRPKPPRTRPTSDSSGMESEAIITIIHSKSSSTTPSYSSPTPSSSLLWRHQFTTIMTIKTLASSSLPLLYLCGGDTSVFLAFGKVFLKVMPDPITFIVSP